MAGQFLQGTQVDAGTGAERQVGGPQGVEIGEERAVRSRDGVGDASELWAADCRTCNEQTLIHFHFLLMRI
jgi:hypothetical protein